MPTGPGPTAGAGVPTSPTPTAVAAPPTGSAAPAGTPRPGVTPACEAVAAARQNALNGLAPLAAILNRSELSREQLANATNDLNTVYTTMHVGVAGAVELTGDPKLKAKISAYQLAVEQAIVAVEGSDSEQAKLKAVIESPAMRTAEKAVLTACA
ncbi:hypothetical protein [Catellatospora vulcania]|uniref:hypothetical protein n=1 Tax=Catellatospora vulcania TaxID=1460450 RepID=UPI0012D3B6CC|nr:hypothetical protein [Catellatospora vulcania]